MNNDPYLMLDPTAESSPVMRERVTPPASLAGLKVGLLSISKERSDEFLNTVAARLGEQGIETVRFAKPTHTKPAPPEVLHAVADGCDVVIEGLAD
ncbi:MAG: hypothetical protein HOI95_19835 [Chromatiales bacterium]|jgi:hypothetical protein|nr:hypothetical protein [Chromatiales bacterium]